MGGEEQNGAVKPRKRNGTPEEYSAHLARRRELYWKNRQREIEKNRAWKAKNRDRIKAYKKKYAKNHPEKVQAWQRATYLRNRDKRLKAAKAYHVANRDEVRAKAKQHRIANPELYREHRLRNRANNRAGLMLSNTKKSAKNTGVAFDLDREWFRSRLAAGVCEMSGLPFELASTRLGWGRNPNGPSVDRIVAGGGYTKSNCRMILWSLNRALGNWGDDYFLRVFRAILERRGEMAASESVRVARNG